MMTTTVRRVRKRKRKKRLVRRMYAVTPQKRAFQPGDHPRSPRGTDKGGWWRAKSVRGWKRGVGKGLYVHKSGARIQKLDRGRWRVLTGPRRGQTFHSLFAAEKAALQNLAAPGNARLKVRLRRAKRPS